MIDRNKKKEKPYWIIVVVVLTIITIWYFFMKGSGEELIQEEEIETTATPSVIKATSKPTPLPTVLSENSEVSPSRVTEQKLKLVLNDFALVATNEWGFTMGSTEKVEQNTDGSTVGGYVVKSNFIEADVNFDTFSSIVSKYDLKYDRNLDGYATEASSQTYTSKDLACSIFLGTDPTQTPGNFVEITCW